MMAIAGIIGFSESLLCLRLWRRDQARAVGLDPLLDLAGDAAGHWRPLAISLPDRSASDSRRDLRLEALYRQLDPQRVAGAEESALLPTEHRQDHGGIVALVDQVKGFVMAGDGLAEILNGILPGAIGIGEALAGADGGDEHRHECGGSCRLLSP